MSFIKKLTGKEAAKSSGCCGVEIKEVENTQESCCGTSQENTSCCGTNNEQQSSCC